MADDKERLSITGGKFYMKQNKTVPVFFASDKNYLPYLTVAVKSLVNKTSENNNYNIYILTNDLTNEDIHEMKELEKSNVSINVVDVNPKIESIKSKVALRDYYSVSIYFRLFIPTLFPELDKAIYLDSDIVLNRDIADMFNEEIGNNYLGAVLDETVYTNKDFIYYVNEALDVSEKQYFNSGVLIMNLKKFRDNDIENDFYRWVNSYDFGTVAPDQDYLNCISKNKVKYLELGWNKMPLGEVLPDEKLYLIHYNMFFKPWKYENTMFDSYFWDIAKTTSFYDFIKNKQQSYTDEQKEQDQVAAQNLLKLAVNIANSNNNYKSVVLKKPKKIEKVIVEQIEMDDELFDFVEVSVKKRKS